MTTELIFRSDIVTKLVGGEMSDEMVEWAMLVSSDKEPLEGPEAIKRRFGRINALMRDRHGTPFEHNLFTFYSEAPIFVYREWHRHRIGVSINEQSGRYSELPPMFYVPPLHRPLVKVEGSKQMEYKVEQASPEQWVRLVKGEERVCAAAYEEYERRLADGIVKESARTCLPVSIYSKMYWSCNARSLMSFLSLRTRHEPYWQEWNHNPELYAKNPGGAQFPSKPQWEINVAADAIERLFSERMPMTYEAFVKNGRVAP